MKLGAICQKQQREDGPNKKKVIAVKRQTKIDI